MPTILQRILHKIKHFKIKTKLVVLYGITILLPWIIVSQIATSLSAAKILDQSIQNTQSQVNQFSHNISEMLQNYITMSNRMAFSDPMLRRYFTTGRQYERVRDSIDAYVDYLRFLRLYGIDGEHGYAFFRLYFYNETLLQDRRTFIFVNDEVRNLEQYQRAAELNGDIAWGILENGHYIFASRAIFDDFQEPIGVLSIEISERRIHSLLQEARLEQMELILANSDGDIISSNNRARLGTSIADTDYFRYVLQGNEDYPIRVENGRYNLISSLLRDNPFFPDWYILALLPMESIYEDANSIRDFSTTIFFVCFFISTILFLLFINRMTNRINRLSRRMQTVKAGEFKQIDSNSRGAADEIGTVVDCYNDMVSHLETLIYEKYQSELAVREYALRERESELYVLQSQTNPHFLFNSLESIRMKLLNDDAQEAGDMIFSLSQVLRMSLDWYDGTILLKQELAMIYHYARIIKARFKKINFDISVPEEFMDCEILKFSIQPLVENAVKHGLEKKKDGGLISVEVTENRQTLCVVVSDDGIGIEPERLSEMITNLKENQEPTITKHIGLHNINERLRIHYGSDYGLHLESVQGQGTTVMIRLPIKRSEDAKGNISR